MFNLYRSGKTPKAWYFMCEALHKLVPSALLRWRMRRELRTWRSRPDAQYIARRVDYYCRFSPTATYQLSQSAGAPDLSEARSVYRYDITRLLRHFPPHLKLEFKPGDVFVNPSVPTLIKARRLDMPGGENAVILPLNALRHFPRPHDNIKFGDKIPQLIFRGKIADKPVRVQFFERFFGHPDFDLGDTGHDPRYAQWHKPKISIADHFRYRYVLVLEGNDVGSALGWVMGSNCVPVMTAPQVTHWLMHSLLVPGKHYIEVAPDFSDLDEKLRYYNAHPQEAERIAQESKLWYSQFSNRKRERLIARLTVAQYFNITGQLQPIL